MFSNPEKSFFNLCNERYVVVLEMAKEISNKEYELFFKEQFYLVELQQFTWRNSTEQKYGLVSDLIIADYESVFDHSYNFNLIRFDKNWREKAVYVSTSYQHTKIFRWFV